MAAYGEARRAHALRRARDAAWHDSLADFAFAMQGLGTGSISLFGSEEIKAKYLPPVREAESIAAFALVRAGSRIRRRRARHHRGEGGPAHVRIDGVKTWISNGGIADHYVVFARTGEAPGARGCPLSSSMPTRPVSKSPAASR